MSLISASQLASKPHVEVAAAIIFNEGHILISQRDEKSHLSGYWEFPGGKREPDESFEECVRREIREELNVDIEVERYFETVQYEYSEKIVLLNFYFCRYLGGEAQALGSRQCKWVPLPELGNYQFPPANEPVLQKLLQA
ncbi:MAG: 8-oxo-dGTP diphosphatase MutT [Acidobacteria bacterium]|nr:8-oxo-dGTP diphosphatase MutT [Acidobacteriota bacterium]MCI0717635.1 8-oxo-dGTP diphosphatase MutT [Acidobacteriota bacterium]